MINIRKLIVGSKDRSRGATAMTISTRSVTKKALLVSTVAVGAAGLFASSAFAVDQDFTLTTTGGCGSIMFDDFGVINGKQNDDYSVIQDRCRDGKGVRARIFLNGKYIGVGYNGMGNGTSFIYDPFTRNGNVNTGDTVLMEVCLVDGAGDTTPVSCVVGAFTSIDG